MERLGTIWTIVSNQKVPPFGQTQRLDHLNLMVLYKVVKHCQVKLKEKGFSVMSRHQLSD